MRFNDVKFHSRSVKGKNYVTLDFYVQPVLKNAGTLIAKSAQDTVSTVRMVWYSLIGLLTGKYGINDMAGPIGMADVVGQAVTEGLKQNFIAGLNNVIYIMMMVTVNLGVFNLVPFPALDGGKLLFLIVEAVRRKPIQAKYQGAVEAAGFCILIGFMLLVCYSDILRLVTGKGLGG